MFAGLTAPFVTICIVSNLHASLAGHFILAFFLFLHLHLSLLLIFGTQ